MMPSPILSRAKDAQHRGRKRFAPEFRMGPVEILLATFQKKEVQSQNGEIKKIWANLRWK